jgi:hypothetical protein
VASDLATGAFTIAGVVVGAAGAIVQQYMITRESKRASKAAARAALRSERKEAVLAFLAICQRVEGAAEARAFGREPSGDLDALKQDLWYQQKCIELVAGNSVRSAAFTYAKWLTTAIFDDAPTGAAIFDFIAQQRLPFINAAQTELEIPRE